MYKKRKTNVAANIYLLKIDNRNKANRSEIYLKLTIKTPKQHHRRDSGVFTDLFLVIILLTFARQFFANMLFGIRKSKKRKKTCALRKYEKTHRILKDNFTIFERNKIKNDLAFPKVFHCLYKPKS